MRGGAARGVLGKGRVALAAVAVVAFSVLSAPVAYAAAPAVPTAPAPSDGATGVATPVQLRVTASDADGGDVEVAFHGRPVGAAPSGGDFTFAVIPDTQNYGSVALNATMSQQTQWLVDNRAALNLAFVSHLGDLVGTATNTTQWGYIDRAMAILDAAGVPNSVVPGNHDYADVNAGSAPLYRQTFPPSRYAQAAWNSPTASYGGYLGQNQFGPDPVDTQNMNSFSLFTAAGMDFLVLNIEFNAPDYVLDWAKRVLAAHPQRRAILVTHSFVHHTGVRSTADQRVGGNTAAQIWDELVFPSCSIFMVVNGHWHSPAKDEANRTDPNSCGRPVHQALSDYQERVNGGDGWLRYYTFKPASDQIQAVTYSPKLNRFETDADSAFTLAYDMPAPPPATMPELGRVTVASGATATLPWPNPAPSTAYEWYATVSDATTTTTGPRWTFTTAAAPGGGVLAADAFGRAVTGGWGSADTGGAWTLTGSASRFSVAGGAGVHSVPAGSTNTAVLGAVSSTSTDASVELALDALPNGPVTAWLLGRRVGATDYAARAKVAANGAVELHATRGGTVLAGGAVPGLTLTAGQQLQLRVQVEGTSPTAVRARAWRVGAAEPTTWQVTTTDATAGLQVAGAVGVSTYLSSSATNGPAVVRYDDLSARPVGGAPPPGNTPPTAAFTRSATGLTLAVDGSTSSDPDGTVASYAWSFGDGATATGATASHPYASAGTYTVTLTVTDDDGATDVESAPVTVTAPGATALAADGFGRTVSSGWGTADTGGAWSVTGSATRYSVSGGAGVQTVPAASTNTAVLDAVSSSSTDATVRVGLDAVPNGPVSLWLIGRRVGTTDYAARVKVGPTGAVELHATRGGAVLAGGVVAGLTVAAGQQLQVRAQVQGASPTTVRARVWRVGTAEPTTWQVTTTDATAGLQGPGAVGVSTYLSSSTTNGPVVVRYDGLDVRPIG